MNKISSPRIGYDGKERTLDDIIKLFYKDIEGQILGRLNNLTNLSQAESALMQELLNDLHDILTEDPVALNIRKDSIQNRYEQILSSKAKGSFNKKIYKAFGYETYRKTKLPALARMLNIKSCPYCNSSYTLYIDVRNVKHPRGIAFLQFDHFFSKSNYPYLSMSFYNLIPSCPVCNLAKRVVDFDVRLNPYICDIYSLFKFEVKDPKELWFGGKVSDTIDILLKSSKGNMALVKELDDNLYLRKRYARHQDIIQEVFDKAYERPYYETILKNKFSPNGGNYWLRLLLGTYTKPEDIEKRPMTKFIQDLWEQANNYYHRCP